MDKPNKLSDIPKINKSYIDEKYFTICTPEIILDYFNSITNKSLRINSLNGIELDGISFYYCDYCDKNIIDDWYYCWHCHKDMCKKCHYKIDEESAINDCNSLHKIQPRNIYQVTEPAFRYCDVCEGDILKFEDRYTVRAVSNTTDVCMCCYKNNKNAKKS